jgi:addiction module HigA family antidote
MLPKNRPPTSPGEVLAEEFLKPMGMTQSALAEKLGVIPMVVSGLVLGGRAISAEMGVKLSRVFGTTWLFWANLQTNVDLWNAERKLARPG